MRFQPWRTGRDGRINPCSIPPGAFVAALMEPHGHGRGIAGVNSSLIFAPEGPALRTADDGPRKGCGRRSGRSAWPHHRGRCGSLLLDRGGLLPSAFPQSPGAPVHSITSGSHQIIDVSDYELGITNNPRVASSWVNCWTALSVIVKLLAFSICRRSAFKAGSLSLITHRHTNTLAS
jgi:hypothetical protein